MFSLMWSSDEVASDLCRDYIDIYIKLAEKLQRPTFTTLNITSGQRQTVIDWLEEICDTYKLPIDTLSTVVYILDSYFCRKRQPLGRIQLVTGACLLIDSKYIMNFSPFYLETSLVTKNLTNKSFSQSSYKLNQFGIK
jgi:hypothetical protein